MTGDELIKSHRVAQTMLSIQRFLIDCGGVPGVPSENIVIGFESAEAPMPRIVCTAKSSRIELRRSANFEVEATVRMKTAATRESSAMEHFAMMNGLIERFQVPDLAAQLEAQVDFFGVNQIREEGFTMEVDEDSQETPCWVSEMSFIVRPYGKT